ncbi:signal transduction histidine kinase [Nocardioides cavernae]|uniref:histidine kinase n=1 Tax=Nocardioides cavernae TaxID=1921566 RepID=A0A7Y9KR77_9ACTN|nr:histidine kinase [Nocardioides cavernae]NYE35022.1 signal transduction histidine kinase [Nocardioides cavernae]
MLTYARSLVRSVWRLPAPADARPPGSLDLALVAAAGVLGVVEATVLRPEMDHRVLTLVSFLFWLPSLLVRRTIPVATVVVFAVVMCVATVLAGGATDDLNTAVVALLIPYSLTRWARGDAMVGGLSLFLLVAGISLVSQPLATADRVGGTAVVVAAAAVGAVLRTRSMLRSRQLDDVRRAERESLARDLHDTVAHHLTAIAITAQAGLAVADSRPGAARDALRRIDEEATRTLAETRTVVRMLRAEDDVPDRPLADLADLAEPQAGGPVVDLALDADLATLAPTTAAAIHRIAQEAVANARRHAADATEVRVHVTATGEEVELTVTDDGAPGVQSPSGFGILGMTERAALLGGTLEAGPRADRGWRVRAVLPREESR